MSIWAATLPQAAEETGAQPQLRRYMPGAPEIYFGKMIDNSRLVKIADPRRRREMTFFAVALAVLLVLAMAYLCQHFRAIDYGYKIETLRSERETLSQANRALKLEEASLRDPGRIDALAKAMGLQMPQAGQVQAMDASIMGSGPVMARATGVSVISLPD
jgi:cell division protein FtsL